VQRLEVDSKSSDVLAAREVFEDLVHRIDPVGRMAVLNLATALLRAKIRLRPSLKEATRLSVSTKVKSDGSVDRTAVSCST
jgi:hypothetical protein